MFVSIFNRTMLGYTPCICRSYVDTINSIQGRHIQAVIPRLHGYMDTNTINKGIRDETIKKFLLNRKSTKKGVGAIPCHKGCSENVPYNRGDHDDLSDYESLKRHEITQSKKNTDVKIILQLA